MPGTAGRTTARRPVTGRPAPVDRDRPGTMAGTFGRAVVQVLPAWVAARVLVALSLVLAHLLVDWSVRTTPGPASGSTRGCWPGTAAGTRPSPATATRPPAPQSVRFFPAFPMAARVLGWIPGIGVGTALVVIANLCALAAMAALLVLVAPRPGRRRAGPALGLAAGPGPGGLLAWSWATPTPPSCCASSSPSWPPGPAGGGGRPRPGWRRGWSARWASCWWCRWLIEVWRDRPDRAPRASAAGWPAGRRGRTGGRGRRPTWAGSGAQFGDPWLPFRVQQQNGHRGAITVPVAAMWHNLESVVHGHHLGSALHIPWVVLSVVLLVVAFRRLPLSYAAFATAVLAVSVTSSNLDSLRAVRARGVPPGHRRLHPDLPAAGGGGGAGRGRGWAWWATPCWPSSGVVVP